MSDLSESSESINVEPTTLAPGGKIYMHIQEVRGDFVSNKTEYHFSVKLDDQEVQSTNEYLKGFDWGFCVNV